MSVISRLTTVPTSAVYRLLTILASGVFLGWVAISLEPFRFVGGMIATLGTLVALFSPELAILGVVAATSSIIAENATPKLPFLGGSFRAYDLLLFFLLALAALQSLHPRGGVARRTPLDLPLMLFFGAALVSLYQAMSNPGTDPSTALQEFRRVAYYLVFFAVTRLVSDRRQLVTLIRGLIFLSLLVGAAMVLQAAVGSTFRVIPGRIPGAEGIGPVKTRSILLVFVMFVTLISMAVLEREKGLQPLRLAQAGLLAPALLLTQLRNLWGAAVLVLVLLTSVVEPRKRARMIVLASIALATVLILLPPLTALSERSGAYVESVADRAVTIINGEDNTLSLRLTEIDYAIEHILRNPIFGIGVGGSYRPPLWEGDEGTGAHNGYLWIQLKLGAVGLVAFLWFSLHSLVRGFRHWRGIQDPFLRACLLGLTLGYLGIMSASFLGNRFAGDLVAPTVLGLIAGVNEVIIRTSQPFASEKEPTLAANAMAP